MTKIKTQRQRASNFSRSSKPTIVAPRRSVTIRNSQPVFLSLFFGIGEGSDEDSEVERPRLAKAVTAKQSNLSSRKCGQVSSVLMDLDLNGHPSQANSKSSNHSSMMRNPLTSLRLAKQPAPVTQKAPSVSSTEYRGGFHGTSTIRNDSQKSNQLRKIHRKPGGEALACSLLASLSLCGNDNCRKPKRLSEGQKITAESISIRHAVRQGGLCTFFEESRSDDNEDHSEIFESGSAIASARPVRPVPRRPQKREIVAWRGRTLAKQPAARADCTAQSSRDKSEKGTAIKFAYAAAGRSMPSWRPRPTELQRTLVSQARKSQHTTEYSQQISALCFATGFNDDVNKAVRCPSPADDNILQGLGAYSLESSNAADMVPYPRYTGNTALTTKQRLREQQRRQKAAARSDDQSQLAGSLSQRRVCGTDGLLSLFQERLSLREIYGDAGSVFDSSRQFVPEDSMTRQQSTFVHSCVGAPQRVDRSLERPSIDYCNDLPSFFEAKDRTLHRYLCVDKDYTTSKRSVLTTPLLKVESKRRDSKNTPGKMCSYDRTSSLAGASSGKCYESDEHYAMEIENAPASEDDVTASSLSDESASESLTRVPQLKPLSLRELATLSPSSKQIEELRTMAVRHGIDEPGTSSATKNLIDCTHSSERKDDGETDTAPFSDMPATVEKVEICDNVAEITSSIKSRSITEDRQTSSPFPSTRQSHGDQNVAIRPTFVAHEPEGFNLIFTKKSEPAIRETWQRADTAGRRDGSRERPVEGNDAESRVAANQNEQAREESKSVSATEDADVGTAWSGADLVRVSVESNVMAELVSRPRRNRKKTDFFHNAIASRVLTKCSECGLSDKCNADDDSPNPPHPPATRSTVQASCGRDVVNRQEAEDAEQSRRDENRTDFFHLGCGRDCMASRGPNEIICDGSVDPTSEKPFVPTIASLSIAKLRQLRIAKRIPKRNVVAEAIDGWSSAQLEQLVGAHGQVDPTISSFWLEVASLVEEKTASECRHQWFSTVKTPAPKFGKRSAGIKSASKQSLDDDDDIFDSTPMRGCLFPKMNAMSTKTEYAVTIPSGAMMGNKLQQSSLRSGVRPHVYKSFLQRMKRDVSRAEKKIDERKPVKRNVDKCSKTLSEVLHEDDIDIKIRLSPGGTLRVQSQVEDADDVWNDMYDTEDEDEETVPHW